MMFSAASGSVYVANRDLTAWKEYAAPKVAKTASV
jgi:hypothetical protein